MIERMRRSMVLHLALAFAAGITLLLSGTGLFLFSSVERAVNAQVDRDLLDATKVTLHRLDDDGFKPDKELLDLGEHLHLRVIGRKGELLLESKGMALETPRERFPLPLQAWSWAEGFTSSGVKVKLLSTPYREGWIQVVRNMHPEVEMLRSFRQSLLILAVAIPFLAAALGYGLVKLGMRPLEQIRAKATGIGPGTLGLRIDSSKLPIELDPLAGTLNTALDRLEVAFTRLAELNADLAHELRTPVHALRLEAESLLRSGRLTLDTREQVENMMETLDHLSALIEQMLFLARAEDPGTHIERSPIDPVLLLERAARPFESLAEERSISIRLGPAKGSRLKGDPVLLQRALHNLLANALRHSPAEGTILVRARQVDGACVLSVEDRGAGLSPETLAQVGQRFIRPDASRSRETGGTGLGLAIVDRIAKLHGGRLVVENREGGGTVAKITLPWT